MAEQWARIDEAPGYEVSSLGAIRSLRSTPARLMAQQPTYKGYLQTELRSGGKKRGFMVNRTVCRAFHGLPPSPKHVAAHLDGNKLNNRADNLAWVTPAENSSHRIAHGTHSRGSNSPCARLSERDVHNVRRRLEGGESARSIARDYDVNSSTISSIRTGRSWAWLNQGAGRGNTLPSNKNGN